MKKILIFLITCFIFFISSCVYGSNNNVNTNKKIEDVEVYKYQEIIKNGESYDEDSVYVRVTFSDGSANIYRGDNLEFDYSDFDFDKSGSYSLKITIKELNISQTVSVKL